jgi:hypothetical protein
MIAHFTSLLFFTTAFLETGDNEFLRWNTNTNTVFYFFIIIGNYDRNKSKNRYEDRETFAIFNMTGLKINLFSIPLATNKKTKIKKSRVREVTRLVRDKTPGCKTRGVLASASLDFGFVLPSVTVVFSQ